MKNPRKSDNSRPFPAFSWDGVPVRQAAEPQSIMKPSIPSLLAISLFLIPSVHAQDRPAPVPPAREEAGKERPERREAQRRERAEAAQQARPERRDAAPGPSARPVPPHSPEMVRAHRVAMERLERMERTMRERDAAMGKVARELNARIDRLEAVAKKPAPPQGGDKDKDKDKPVADERLRKAAGELEARMKRVGELEKKLGEREGELKKRAEMLEKREKELREMGEKVKAAANGLEAREKRLREMEQGLRKKKERKAGGD